MITQLFLRIRIIPPEVSQCIISKTHYYINICMVSCHNFHILNKYTLTSLKNKKACLQDVLRVVKPQKGAKMWGKFGLDWMWKNSAVLSKDDCQKKHNCISNSYWNCSFVQNYIALSKEKDMKCSTSAWNSIPLFLTSRNSRTQLKTFTPKQLCVNNMLC